MNNETHMNNETQKPRIGFIGMGSMGSLMAIRLLQAGYALSVYDRTKEKAQETTQNGARVTETARELALMHKDFGLITRQASELGVSMPATAVAEQMYAAALASGLDADYSVMLQFMRAMAGLKE